MQIKHINGGRLSQSEMSISKRDVYLKARCLSQSWMSISKLDVYLKARCLSQSEMSISKRDVCLKTRCLSQNETSISKRDVYLKARCLYLFIAAAISCNLGLHNQLELSLTQPSPCLSISLLSSSISSFRVCPPFRPDSFCKTCKKLVLAPPYRI